MVDVRPIIHTTSVAVNSDIEVRDVNISSATSGSEIGVISVVHYYNLCKDLANAAAASATSANNYSAAALVSSNNSKIWAEGTDEQVQALGGTHSSKGWVDYVMENAPTASVSKTGNISTLTVTDIHGTTTTNIYDGSGVPGAGTIGQVLTKNSNTDYDVKWSTVDALPSQSGQSGKFLTTNGTNPSWQDIPTEVDNETISLNTENELQAIGVIDQNTGIKKFWSGTKAQYDAITTKDANTLYNVKGDNDAVAYNAYTKAETDTLLATKATPADISTAISTMLSSVYPVGSIYIGTTATCPMASLITGSVWTLKSQDRVLQGAGTRGSVGTTLNESLPNINAAFSIAGYSDGATSLINDTGGSIYKGSLLTTDSGCNFTSSTGKRYGIYMDASRSSSTYQDNAPVQQNAYLVNIWERTA